MYQKRIWVRPRVDKALKRQGWVKNPLYISPTVWVSSWDSPIVSAEPLPPGCRKRATGNWCFAQRGSKNGRICGNFVFFSSFFTLSGKKTKNGNATRKNSPEIIVWVRIFLCQRLCNSILRDQNVIEPLKHPIYSNHLWCPPMNFRTASLSQLAQRHIFHRPGFKPEATKGSDESLESQGCWAPHGISMNLFIPQVGMEIP